MERGNRRMLNSDKATNALSAVSLSSGLSRLIRVYVANVAKETCMHEMVIIMSYYCTTG